MENIFDTVGVKNRIQRSLFDLSYEKKLTADFGLIYPVGVWEIVPGDVIQLEPELIVRLTPLVSPALQEINVSIHHFVCSKRALWELGGYADSFEEFITRGEDGTSAPTHPSWAVTTNTLGSLWDYLGFPLSVDCAGIEPDSTIRDMYNNIYNEYYREQHIHSEVALTQETILRACWEKDYFTSAQITQLLGTAPSFPVSGSVTWPAVSTSNNAALQMDSAALLLYDAPTKTTLEKNTLSATTFDIADFRLALMKTMVLELNQRAGSRYIEQTKARYGIAPIDERLYRSEYIGGSKHHIIMSEVLQTSETNTTVQGTMVGHGLGVARANPVRYRNKEFGYLMTMMVIRPSITYSGQGVNRQYYKSTVDDYFHPEYIDLSEREVYRGELYATSVAGDNTTIFGYQGMYDELRQMQDQVVNKFRVGQNMDHYHCARSFSSGPTLNSTFIECDPREEIFAAPSEPVFLVSFGNNCKMVRPLPYKPIPFGGV